MSVRESVRDHGNHQSSTEIVARCVEWRKWLWRDRCMEDAKASAATRRRARAPPSAQAVLIFDGILDHDVSLTEVVKVGIFCSKRDLPFNHLHEQMP